MFQQTNIFPPKPKSHFSNQLQHPLPTTKIPSPMSPALWPFMSITAFLQTCSSGSVKQLRKPKRSKELFRDPLWHEWWQAQACWYSRVSTLAFKINCKRKKKRISAIRYWMKKRSEEKGWSSLGMRLCLTNSITNNFWLTLYDIVLYFLYFVKSATILFIQSTSPVFYIPFTFLGFRFITCKDTYSLVSLMAYQPW